MVGPMHGSHDWALCGVRASKLASKRNRVCNVSALFVGELSSKDCARCVKLARDAFGVEVGTL